MVVLTSLLSLGVVALPLLAAINAGWVVQLEGKRADGYIGLERREEYKGRLTAFMAIVSCWAMAVAWACATAALALVIANGPTHWSLIVWTVGGAHVQLFGLLTDRLSAALLLLVTTVSGVVHVYARRAMVGEPRYAAFFMRLGLVTVAVLLVILSDNLLMLFVFWALKGLALTGLLQHYRERAASRRAASHKLQADLIGDSAFALALALTWRTFGTFDLGVITQQAGRVAASGGLAPITAIATLLLVAAMAKSALVPLQGWLPESVESPTPVSALMHAGLINAGGFLLVRLSPLFVAAPLALMLAVVVGLVTALYGTAVMLTRNDVKSMLAFSTMGQMGFMVLECGLGAFAIAMLHLVAHGLYKATLFLGFGDAVRQGKLEMRLAQVDAPNRRLSPITWGVALTLPAAALAGSAILLRLPLDTGIALLVFAWATGAQALVSLLRRRAIPVWLAALAVALGVFGYVALVAGALRFLAPVVAPAPTSPALGWLGLALVIVALALLVLLMLADATARRPRTLTNWLYVTTLHAGYVGEAPVAPLRWLRRRPLVTARRPTGTFVTLAPPEANTSDTSDTTLTAEPTFTGVEAAAQVRAAVAEAAQIIAPVWPVGSFIAANPLGGLEELPFEQAVRHASLVRGGHGYLAPRVYQRLRAEGRIADTDLRAALAEVIDETTANPRHSAAMLTTPWPGSLTWEWLLGEAEKPADAVGVSREDVDISSLAWRMGDIGETATLADLFTQRSGEASGEMNGVVAALNARMIVWSAAFLDQGQAAWRMPGRERGFYACWRALAPYDTVLRQQGMRGTGRRVRALTEDAASTLAATLLRLGIPRDRWAGYLARHLAQLPGWAGAIRWREEHPAEAKGLTHATLVEYLAIRLFYEAELVDQVARERLGVAGTYPALSALTIPSARAENIHTALGQQEQISWAAETLAADQTSPLRAEIWQRAYERGYRRQLLAALRTTAHETRQHRAGHVSNIQRPATQALFCIDVRSEGLRRNLEALGDSETFGVAGFFGVPFFYRPFGSDHETALGPALITPDHSVTETPRPGAEAAAQRSHTHDNWRRAWRALLHETREGLLTPFAWVEATGWTLVALLVARTLAPRLTQRVAQQIERRLSAPSAFTDFTLDADADGATNSAPIGWSLDDRATLMETMLRGIGLTKGFARLVLLCGHASETANNPYAAALDCGACGGNAGGVNARVASAMLNEPAVRERLRERGIIIPADTVFVAGEHMTTTDQVSLLDTDRLPATHRDDLQRMTADLRRAGARNAAERCRELDGAPHLGEDTATRARRSTRHVAARAADWAQTRPEWGLARNAAFICGSRALTAGLDLEGRVFLQSYDPAQDPEGAALEGLLAAPVVVGEWINMQYYFSTVDNATYGSGTKLLHTVVGRMGVMQGQRSDLRAGLPWQSVMAGMDGERPYHEPLRLLVVVEAEPERIERILARQAVPHRLVTNGWITLVACEPTTKRFFRRTRTGVWKVDEPAEEWIVAERERRQAEEQEEAVAATSGQG